MTELEKAIDILTNLKTRRVSDSLQSLVEQLTEQAGKGLATCQSGDGNPKVVIEFRDLRECQEFYKTLVTLWGGRYELPNDLNQVEQQNKEIKG